MSANEKNVGNVVGLIKSDTAPTKTSVLWFKQTDPVSNPDQGELYMYDSTSETWVTLVSKINAGKMEYRFDKTIIPTVFAQEELVKDWLITADSHPFTLDPNNGILSWQTLYGVEAPKTWNLGAGVDPSHLQKSDSRPGIIMDGSANPVQMVSTDTAFNLLGDTVWSAFFTIIPQFPSSGYATILEQDANNWIKYDDSGNLAISVDGSQEAFASFFTEYVQKTFCFVWDSVTNYMTLYDTSGSVAPTTGNINSGNWGDSTLSLFSTKAQSEFFIGSYVNHAFINDELGAGDVGDIIDELEKAL